MNTTLKATFLSAKAAHGKSKETGRPFEFATITITKSVEAFSNDNFSMDEAYGVEPLELSCDKSVVSMCKLIKSCSPVELSIELRPGRKGLETFVVGVKSAA